MSERYADIQADIAAMGAAVEAINRIPTAWRRRVAWDWICARVEADLGQLQRDEHAERVAETAALVVVDEPEP